MSFAYSPMPHELAATLAREIRNNALPYASISIDLPKDFDAPERIKKAARDVRRALESLPRDPDPWDRAQRVARAFLRGVGYPILKANRLFDAVEPIDRATLEAWIADYRRRADA